MRRLLIFRQANSVDTVGGIERQILQMARWLAAKPGIESILVTSGHEYRFAKEFEALGMPVEASVSNKSILKNAVHLDGIVRKYDVKVIQTHMFRESIIARTLRLVRKDLRHIARVHTYIDCSWIPAWRKLSYHVLEKLMNRGVDLYLPITCNVENELLKRSWIAADRVMVIPDGVAQLGPPDKDRVRPGPLEPKIALVANIVEHKGHDLLIKCLAELKGRGLVVHARFVGGEHTQSGTIGPANRLREHARTLGVLDQIEFYGFTTDVYKAIIDYPVVVLPSESESLPNSILEAMSARKMVVASRVGGIPEIIANGENGFLHEPRDYSALTDILERLFTKPADRWDGIRDRALETWRVKFSVESMIEGLSKAYSRFDTLQ
jgi:glycosyltransferase involved in cell wall biosynthesis